MYFSGSGENLLCLRKSYRFCSNISKTRQVWLRCWKHSNALTKLKSSAFSWLRRDRMLTCNRRKRQIEQLLNYLLVSVISFNLNLSLSSIGWVVFEDLDCNDLVRAFLPTFHHLWTKNHYLRIRSCKLHLLGVLVQMFLSPGTRGLRSESGMLRSRGLHAGPADNPHHPLHSRQRLLYFGPPWWLNLVDRPGQVEHQGFRHHAL